MPSGSKTSCRARMSDHKSKLIRLDGQRRVEIGLPIRGRFARHAENQVERQLHSGFANEASGAADIGRLVIAFERSQLRGLKRLAPRLTRVTPCSA